MAIRHDNKTYNAVIALDSNRHLLVEETYDEVKTLVEAGTKGVEVTVVNSEVIYTTPIPSRTKYQQVVTSEKMLINSQKIVAVKAAL